LTGDADLLQIGEVGSRVERLDFLAGDRGEQGIALTSYCHWREV
jgi:hypothetical protein